MKIPSNAGSGREQAGATLIELNRYRGEPGNRIPAKVADSECSQPLQGKDGTD